MWRTSLEGNVSERNERVRELELDFVRVLLMFLVDGTREVEDFPRGVEVVLGFGIIIFLFLLFCGVHLRRRLLRVSEEIDGYVFSEVFLFRVARE